jgi:hypothetical protein
MRVKVLTKGRKYIVKAGGIMRSKIFMKIKLIIDNKIKKRIDPINKIQPIEISINFWIHKNKRSQ